MKPEILNETPVSMLEVKELLSKQKKEDEELTFRAQKTFEHLEQVVTLKKKQADELFEALEKLKLPRFKEQHINKIIDLLPTKIEELKVIMQAYPLNLPQESMKKIVAEVVKIVG